MQSTILSIWFRQFIVPAGCLIAILLLAATFLQFNGLYGQDAHEYLRLVRSIREFEVTGTAIDHSYFPILYPFAGFFTSLFLHDDIIALQCVSIVSLTIAFFYLRQLVIVVHGNRNLLTEFLIAFFFFSPYVFRFGLISMSDMLCMLFVVASVFHCVFYLQKDQKMDAVLFAGFVAAAMSTRYAVTALLILPVVIVTVRVVVSRKYSTLVMMLFAAFIMLLPDYLLRGRILFFQMNNGTIFIDYATNAYDWSVWNFFRSGFQNADGVQTYSQWNLVAVAFNLFHPAFIFAGALFVSFLRSSDFDSLGARLLLLMVLCYAFYIAGLHYQNNRYLLQSFPMATVLFYPAFDRMVDRFSRHSCLLKSAIAIVIVLQLMLFWYSFRSILALNRTEQAVCNALSAYPGQRIYTCSITGALTTYGIQNPVTDIYFNDVSLADTNALLLFNHAEFSKHFDGMNPMKAWKLLNDAHALRLLQTLPGGWELYSIENRNQH